MLSRLKAELRQRLPFSSLEEEVYLSLVMATQRTVEPWDRYLRTESELTLTQHNVLRILRGAHPEGVTHRGISERMITRDPDVTRLVDRLERRGAVRRVRDPEDRRTVRVHITEKGLRLLSGLDEAVERMPKVMLKGLNRSELRALRDLLATLIARPRVFP